MATVQDSHSCQPEPTQEHLNAMATKPKTTPKGDATQKTKIHWSGPVAVLLIAAAAVSFAMLDSPPPGEAYPDQGNLHLEAVDTPHIPYNSSPESSGPHTGFLAPWGWATDPVPEEVFVHNLEDGAVVVVYASDVPAVEVARLADELEVPIDGNPKRRILFTGYDKAITDQDGNEHRFAAVGWTRVFTFDELTEENLSELNVFIRIYEGVDNH